MGWQKVILDLLQGPWLLHVCRAQFSTNPMHYRGLHKQYIPQGPSLRKDSSLVKLLYYFQGWVIWTLEWCHQLQMLPMWSKKWMKYRVLEGVISSSVHLIASHAFSTTSGNCTRCQVHTAHRVLLKFSFWSFMSLNTPRQICLMSSGGRSWCSLTAVLHHERLISMRENHKSNISVFYFIDSTLQMRFITGSYRCQNSKWPPVASLKSGLHTGWCKSSWDISGFPQPWGIFSSFLGNLCWPLHLGPSPGLT